MGSRRFDSDGSAVAFGRPQRCRLLVWGAGVDDVVAAAGGYLCDRARLGWDVTVLLDGDGDRRALSILGIGGILGIGAEPQHCEVAAVIAGLGRGDALMVSVEQLARDACIRNDLARVARRGVNDVTVWGRPAAGEVGVSLEPAAHRLSTAARAFKMHALAASGVPAGTAVESTESLFRLRGPLRGLHPV